MISFYGDNIYKCEECGKTSDYPFTDGLCSTCTYKNLVSKINSLCDSCRKKCKQSSLISIQHCPNYNQKVSFKAPNKPSEPSLTKTEVSPKKKTKKVLKQTKRKK